MQYLQISVSYYEQYDYEVPRLKPRRQCRETENETLAK